MRKPIHQTWKTRPATKLWQSPILKGRAMSSQQRPHQGACLIQTWISCGNSWQTRVLSNEGLSSSHLCSHLWTSLRWVPFLMMTFTATASSRTGHKISVLPSRFSKALALISTRRTVALSWRSTPFQSWNCHLTKCPECCHHWTKALTQIQLRESQVGGIARSPHQLWRKWYKNAAVTKPPWSNDLLR